MKLWGRGRNGKVIFVPDPEMIEDTVNIVNEATKDKIQVNLIINNRAGGNAPLIAQKIADRSHSEKPTVSLLIVFRGRW